MPGMRRRQSPPQRAPRFFSDRGSARAGACTALAFGATAALLPLDGNAAPSPGPSAIATLASTSADFDHDGRADTVFVSTDGRLVVLRASGGEEALPLAAGAAVRPIDASSKVTLDVVPADAPAKAAKLGERFLRVRVARTATQSDLYVVPLRLPLALAFAGPVGPIGRDGEYSVEVEVAGGPPAGLVRFQRAPGLARCDGESRLFLERYRDGAFHSAPELTLPAAPAGAHLAATAAAPAGVSGEPLGVYRFAAASAQGGVRRADQLSPPRELEDGQRGTAWLLPGGGVGEWAVARAETEGSSVRALRLTPASPTAGSLPQKLVVLLGKSERPGVAKGAVESFAFELPVAATGPLWLALPSKSPADCLALVITAGPARGGAAIAEVAVFADLDTDSDGLERLVKQVAGSDRLRSGGPMRMLLLLSKQPARLSALLAALQAGFKGASGEGKRRLFEPMLSAIAAVAGTPPDSPQRGAAAELLDEALRTAAAPDRPALFSAAFGLGTSGAALVERIGLDAKAPIELRKEALLRLAETKDPRSLPTLIAALRTADSALRQVLAAAVTAALRCKPAEDPGLAVVRTELEKSLPAGPGATIEEGGARYAGTLIDAAARAVAGCSDTGAARSLADLYATFYGRIPGGEGGASFLLRYRLLEGLLTLKVATESSAQLFERVPASEVEPILRQLAVRGALVPGGRSVEWVRRGLGDADPGVRLAALAVLSEKLELVQEAKGLVPVLDELITKDGWPVVRRAAIEVRSAACVAAGKSDDAASLRSAIRDPDAQAQRAALLGLGRCLGERAIETVAALARDVEAFPGSRGQACALLSRYGFSATDARRQEESHNAVREVLLDLIGDPGADERHAAAVTTCLRAVGEHGGGRDVGPIIDLVGSDLDGTIRRLSAEALGKICERDAAGRARLAKSLNKLFRSLDKRHAFEDRLRKAIDAAEAACIGAPDAGSHKKR